MITTSDSVLHNNYIMQVVSCMITTSDSILHDNYISEPSKHDVISTNASQYLDLVGKVCESASMKRPVEKRIPVSAGRGEQQSILEDRKRVSTASPC